MMPLVLVATVVSLWAQTITTTEASPTPILKGTSSANCQGRPDGVYANHALGCQEYFFCKNGHQSRYSCPERQAFSRLRNACMPVEEVICLPPESPEDDVAVQGVDDWLEFSCDARADGAYADLARNCRQFYICKGGARMTHVCPRGSRFSKDSGICMPEESVPCGMPPVSEVCPSMDEGYYADIEGGCNRFYRCLDGRRQEFSCPADFIFNEKQRACVDTANYKCPAERYAGHHGAKRSRITKRQIKFFRPQEGQEPGVKRQIKFETVHGDDEPGVLERVSQLIDELREVVEN